MMAEIQHPMLCCTKPLDSEFSGHSVIKVNNSKFSIGRSLNNTEVIASLNISRSHCILSQNTDSSWTIRDTSRCGIFVNEREIMKNEDVLLKDQDIIQFDHGGIFTYKFCYRNEEIMSRKRKHSNSSCDNVGGRIQDAKDKFDSTQTIEMENMVQKLNTAKQIQSEIINEKITLEKSLQEKILNLESFYDKKIQDLKGREDEIEREKNVLVKQSTEEKHQIETRMKEDIQRFEATLLEQKIHEKKLEEENNALIERLKMERDEFQKRLEEVTISKERRLECLEKQLIDKEQELKDERERMESLRHQETQDLKTAREKELNDLREKMAADQDNKLKHIESLKVQMEMQEHFTKENREMAEKEFQSQIEKLKREAYEMNEQLAARNAAVELARREAEEKLEHERRFLEERLCEKEREKEQLQELLLEKSKQSEQDLQNLQRELVEKGAKVQEQVELEKGLLISLLNQETETCNTTIKQMQHELEVVTSKMHSVQEIIKHKKSQPNAVIDLTSDAYNIPSTSRFAAQMLIASEERAQVLDNVNKIMESELQCSICADLIIEATALNCSHTFCKHCIDTWKQKKKECPVCRAKIKSECRSIVLDSFIEKMVDSMDASVKEKRKQTLAERQMVRVQSPPTMAATSTTATNNPMDLLVTAMGFAGGILPSGVMSSLMALRGREAASRRPPRAPVPQYPALPPRVIMIPPAFIPQAALPNQPPPPPAAPAPRRGRGAARSGRAPRRGSRSHSS